jgi:hypothetical protein
MTVSFLFVVLELPKKIHLLWLDVKRQNPIYISFTKSTVYTKRRRAREKGVDNRFLTTIMVVDIGKNPTTRRWRMELVNDLNKRRGDRLAKILKLRRDFKPCIKSPRLRARLIYDLVGRSAPMKPTAHNLYRAAKAELAYSRSRWSNPHDTEYYSACGYDDMMADARYEAGKYALDLYRAWKALRTAEA